MTEPSEYISVKDNELLIRIDERTKTLANTLQSMQTQMVTQSEFKPIKLIVYSSVGILGAAILGAMIKLVLAN